ncbi:MAG: 50S ribosomal protein L31 [Gammaproteobacteria bacterium]|nr:50S ribosomal protein L31 [Gammaproteobacteria bacterium]
MKKDIHPTFYPDATVVCVCGNTWQTGATVQEIHTDVCSNCHPFYTGEQRIVDTEGQVDRFYKRLQARQEFLEEEDARVSSLTSPEIPITELELGTRAESVLIKSGIEIVGQTLELLNQGDAALLSIDGFGRKSLAILKRTLRKRGFELPEDVVEGQET